MAKNAFDELVAAMLADPNLMAEWQPKRSKPVDSQKILAELTAKQEAMTAELMKSVNEAFGMEVK